MDFQGQLFPGEKVAFPPGGAALPQGEDLAEVCMGCGLGQGATSGRRLWTGDLGQVQGQPAGRGLPGPQQPHPRAACTSAGPDPSWAPATSRELGPELWTQSLGGEDHPTLCGRHAGPGAPGPRGGCSRQSHFHPTRPGSGTARPRGAGGRDVGPVFSGRRPVWACPSSGRAAPAERSALCTGKSQV